MPLHNHIKGQLEEYNDLLIPGKTRIKLYYFAYYKFRRNHFIKEI